MKVEEKHSDGREVEIKVHEKGRADLERRWLT